MTIFFDTDTALTPQSNTSWSKGTRTDFWDNYRSSYNAFTKSELFTSERNNLAEEYVNVVDILTRAGHSGFISPLDNMLIFEGEGEEEVVGYRTTAKIPDRQALETDFWNKVLKLQETDHWALSDRSITDAQKKYRQDLRDLPANTSDPAKPTWPTIP